MAIVNMVLANNCIRLREIQANVINNDTIFNNIHEVSLSTLARILKKNQVHMKQLYKVPFDRNSERVKHLRNVYVEVRIFQLTMVWHCTLCVFMHCTLHTTFLHVKLLCFLLCFRESCKWMQRLSHMNLYTWMRQDLTSQRREEEGEM